MKTLGLALALVAAILVAQSILARGSPASIGAAASPQTGRYQTEIAGSRGPDWFAVAFLLDTVTGKGWEATVSQGHLEGWTEILEPEGKGPAAATAEGTFRMSADMVTDSIGQGNGVAVRVDTRSGTAWCLRSLPPPAIWVLLPDAVKGKPAGSK